MNSARTIGGLIAALVLEGAVQAQSSAPKDFAVRFSYGMCTTDVLDTFKGTYTRDLGPRDSPVTIPITLSVEARQEMFVNVTSSKFSEYPELFRPQGSGFIAPAMGYRLDVRSAGASHTVIWTDETMPSTSEADRLRSLFRKLIALITRQPDIQNLPKAKVLCQ